MPMPRQHARRVLAAGIHELHAVLLCMCALVSASARARHPEHKHAPLGHVISGSMPHQQHARSPNTTRFRETNQLLWSLQQRVAEPTV